MGSNEGHVWVSLSGVGHVEVSEGYFALTRGYHGFFRVCPALYVEKNCFLRGMKSPILGWPKVKK